MVLAILQARMSSTRLPGKVLKNVHGKPMVLRHIERLVRCEKLTGIVVATSVDPSDDLLVEVLEAEGIHVRRGPLADVARRYLDVVDEFRPNHFVRLTADCPLADPEVIDRVVGDHLAADVDYSTVGLTRTFVHGHDVEVVRSSAFRRMMNLELTPSEHEHVTMGIYHHPELFSILEVTQKTDLSHLRWTVDEPEDLEFVQLIYDNLYDENNDFTTADVLDFLAQHPEFNRTTELYEAQLAARTK